MFDNLTAEELDHLLRTLRSSRRSIDVRIDHASSDNEWFWLADMRADVNHTEHMVIAASMGI